MTVFAIDPADSGAIRFNPNVVDTAVMHLPGESTRRLNPPVRRPPANTGRRDTGEQPLFPTGAELAVWGDQWGAHAVVPFQEPPDGSPPPLPPIPAPPSWMAPAGTYPPIGPQPGPQPGPPEPPPVPPPVAEPVTERLTLAVRPKNYHPRHRECRCLPVTTVVVTGVCTGALTNGALLALAWAVAQ